MQQERERTGAEGNPVAGCPSDCQANFTPTANCSCLTVPSSAAQIPSVFSFRKVQTGKRGIKFERKEKVLSTGNEISSLAWLP